MTLPYRYEVKFILNPVQHSEFSSWMSADTQFRQSYESRRVNSLYMDDIDFGGIRDNLAGLPDRSKFRFRWYGDTSGNPEGLKFETKIRLGRVGMKKEQPLNMLKDSFSALSVADLLPLISEAMHNNEGNSSVPLHQLLPVLYINYQREYYEDHAGFRATIDRCVRFQSVKFSDRLVDLRGHGDSHIIAELKFDIKQKNRAADLMRNLHLVPKRHSKYLYGMAMTGTAIYI